MGACESNAEVSQPSTRCELYQPKIVKIDTENVQPSQIEAMIASKLK